MGYTLLLKELARFDTEDIEPILKTLLARHVDGIVWAVPEVGDNHGWVDTKLAHNPCSDRFPDHGKACKSLDCQL